MVAGGSKEDLRLVLQPAERLAVNDAIAIVLIRRPHIVFELGLQAATRLCALGGLRREHLPLALLEPFTDGGQRCPPGSWYRARGARHRSWRLVSARDPQMSGAYRCPSLVGCGVRLSCPTKLAERSREADLPSWARSST